VRAAAHRRGTRQHHHAKRTKAVRARSSLRFTRIETLGVYRVKVSVTTRSARWTTVYVRVGKLATRKLWTARGHHASVTVTMPIRGHSFWVHASDRRTKPVLAIHFSQLQPLSPKSSSHRVNPPPAAHPSVSLAATVAATPAPAPAAAPQPAAPTPLPAQPASAGPLGDSGSWKLVLDDEFNAPETWGSVWSQDRGGPNGRMNNVTADPANVTISGGAAQLTLANSNDGGYISTCADDGGGGFNMGYGYAEARIMLPTSGGQIVGWPAWWIVGSNWPANGEADILEGLGGQATSNYHSNNGTDNSGAIPGNWYDGGWHTYGVDREPGMNYIYWDGKLVRSYPTYDGGAPQCLILNIGSGQGPTVNGAVMQIDYVRVWTH